MSQPPLSVSIRRLEEELGVQLIERHSRGVTLTTEGALVVEQAQEVVRVADNIRLFAKESLGGTRGLLRLGFVGSATFNLIPSLIPRFRALFPNVTLKLSEQVSAEIVAGLLSGDLDAGLLRTPLFDVTGLILTPLSVDRLVLALPYGHAFAERSEIKLEDLANQAMILWSRTTEPWVRTMIDINFSAIGIAPVVVEEASHIHTMLSLVECGLGAALVPSIVRRSSPDRLNFVDLTCKGSPIELGFAMAVREGQGRPLTANFAGVAIEVLQQNSG
ncbi:hypothetical protein ATM17_30550 (plasmid) [Sphingopyxis macrogoltabida]|uniref:HTH lysR-type domain-containing protein n=2 Tax=Sphingopyxis macrogoltabida TaxID=33050 RepID=A0AAC9AZ61_SPHMC|nr:hypothetical protein ATM17_30550 [Sphingopyxis macrogoltabida]